MIGFAKLFKRNRKESTPTPRGSSANLLSDPEQPNGVQEHTNDTSLDPELKEPERAQESDNNQSSDNDSHKSQTSIELCPVDREELRTKLHEARIEYPAESLHFFVPESEKASIITVEVIASEIYTARPHLGRTHARKQAELVCNGAKNLFAILAYLRKGSEICAFMDEGISDKDLPFERSRRKDKKCKFALQRKGGKKINALDDWEQPALESLGRKQWYMIAPIFKDRMKHYELHKNTVLPFVTDEEEEGENTNPTGGGYSDVFTTRIHTSHHRFHSYWPPTDREQKVAIKRLHNGDEKDFEKERSIHVTLGQKQNVSPHLIKLLATYEYQGKFHFIFPRANCNLRKYWESNPTPQFTRKTLLWSLKQMAGIATALNTIHNFRTTVPLDGKRHTSRGELHLSVKKGEELYGRHGDIKPENILWFERIPQNQRQRKHGNTNIFEDDDGGILQITDFGLGRFHGRDSKTEQPNGVFGSPTYEPPECKLGRPVSRLYDLWSLGCLYLEFATWLLKGCDAIENFSDHRACPSSINPLLSDDFFFKVVRDEYGVSHAVVRDGVVDWARTLHADERCSEFIHDLVDLVMDDLLLIDAKDRIQTPWLCVRLRSFLEKAEADPGYLCKPNRRPRDQNARTMSESAIEFSPTTQKKTTSPKKVSFKDQEDSFSTFQQPGNPKDLVFRSTGTPSMINKSKTWPFPVPDISVG